MSGSQRQTEKNTASFRGAPKPPAQQVDSLQVPLTLWSVAKHLAK